jgi:serine/threonine-protein kinase PpkA
MLLGLTGLPVRSAEPDPAEVQRLMDKYIRADEARKAASKPHPKPVVQPRPAPAVDHDHEAWKSAEQCGTAACFEAYLGDYPKGRYAKMARARLESASEPASRPAVITPPVERPRLAMTGSTLVRIAGGCFQMGSPVSETGREPLEPNEKQHRVCVESFEMGKDELTVGEFKQFITASGYKTDAEKDAGGKEGCFAFNAKGDKADWQPGLNWRKPGYEQRDNYPVVCVSWNDALAYTRWLSEQIGQSYRLPTEAEWEYAARAGTTTARYWGDDPDQACQYANVADQTKGPTGNSWTVKHECNDGYVYSAPVGRFQANDLRLNDMLGNVWEWTCSAYDKDYGGAEKACTNNSTGGPLSVRGGAWLGEPARVRSADRGTSNSAFRLNYQGFRLARSL